MGFGREANEVVGERDGSSISKTALETAKGAGKEERRQMIAIAARPLVPPASTQKYRG